MGQDGLLYQHINRIIGNKNNIRSKVGEVIYPVNSDDYFYDGAEPAVEGRQSMPRLSADAIHANQDPAGVMTYQDHGLLGRNYRPAKPKIIAPVLDQLMESGHFDSLTASSSKKCSFGFDVS